MEAIHDRSKCDGVIVTTRHQVLYALPAGATALLYGGPLVVMQGIYAKYYDIPLSTIAFILLIANLFDAVTDPIVGYYSDRYHSRTGTRKPFIIFGSFLFIFGGCFLFSPPEDVSAFYFLLSFLLFYLGSTLFNIPHFAWGNEISGSAKSSTRIFTCRALMVALGGMIFYSIPQLPFFETTEFTPKVLRWAVVISGVLIVPSLILCVYFVPRSYRQDPQEFFPVDAGVKDGDKVKANKSRVAFKSIFKNGPFFLFLLAFFFSGLGLGSWGALIFIFVDSYLDQGWHFSLVALMGMGGGIVGLRIWLAVSNWIGKANAWIVGVVVTVLSIFSMLLLVPDSSSFMMLVMIMLPAFLGTMSIAVFAPALLSDIIDYSKWKFQEDVAGSYFSVYFLITKVNTALGGALGLAVAGWYGFDPSSIDHGSEAIFGLKLAAIFMPIMLFFLSIIFISRIPIDERRHATVCRALSRREKIRRRDSFARTSLAEDNTTYLISASASTPNHLS